MKRSRSFLAFTVLLGVVLCGLVYLLVHAPPAAPATEHAATQPVAGAATARELVRLQREMARLQAQVWRQGQRLAAEPARAEAHAPSTAGEHAPSTAQDPRTDPEARAEQDRTYRKYMAGIDAAFRKEATDPQWSSTTAAVIRTAITGDNQLRTLARDVECRSRTCRVELADDGAGKLDKLLPMFAGQVSQDLPSVAVDRIDDARGGRTIVLYMSRGDDTQAVAP